MSYARARLFIQNVCACSYHWILLIIEVDKAKVEVLDSLYKNSSEYATVRGMVDS